MKIGIVLETSLSVPGGVQNYARGLYDFLETAGHQAEILSYGSESEEDKTRRITRLGKAVEIPLPHSSVLAPFVISRSKAVEDLLEERHFDILHFLGPGILLSRKIVNHSKAVKILTFLIYHKRVTPRIITPFLPLWRRMGQKFSAKIAISQAAASYAQKFHPGHYEIVHGGIDLSEFAPEGVKIDRFSDGKINILFVGRLDRRKGLLYLLKAFRELDSRPDVRLLIIGGGQDMLRAERFVRKNRLRNVVFLGRVGNDVLPRYYRTADIFCSPATHGESFGFVLLEAMASGLPVVAYANEGYREILGKDPFDRFLVRPGDVDELARKLLTFIGDEELRKRIKREGLNEAQKYSWENVGGNILRLYREALS